jgi:hypothetical protein
MAHSSGLRSAARFDSKQVGQFPLACDGDANRPAVADRREPSEFSESSEQSRTEISGDVMTPLGPVQTRMGEAAARYLRAGERYPERFEPRAPKVR